MSIDVSAGILTDGTLGPAAPESFGFLSPRPASVVLNGAKLEFAPMSAVTVAGGDVEIGAAGGLDSEGGDIRIIGSGNGAGAVNVSTGATEGTPQGRVDINAYRLGHRPLYHGNRQGHQFSGA